MAAPDRPIALAGLTRLQALSSTRAYLRGGDIDTADADGRQLLLAACGIDAMALVRDPEVALSAQEADRLEGFVHRRAAHEPTSRIVGHRAFWSIDLAVNPGVLDPRADTEALVRLAVRVARTRSIRTRRILDVGCGSGAILCATLSEFPDAFGIGIDASAAACIATQANVRACGLADRACVVQGSWVEAFDAPFDLILSNPPYIRSDQIAGLDAEVRDHDPRAALDGGADGLDAYRAIFGTAPGLLAPNGALAVEFGLGQAHDVEGLAQAFGLQRFDFESDLAGRDRAAAFCKNPARA